MSLFLWCLSPVKKTKIRLAAFRELVFMLGFLEFGARESGDVDAAPSPNDVSQYKRDECADERHDIECELARGTVADVQRRLYVGKARIIACVVDAKVNGVVITSP